jgi:hypothetical protein
MLKINPMCYSAQNSERSCRNFSIESAKVGFPCAIQPKGPDAEGCPNFEAQASANPDLLSMIQDAAGQNLVDALALGLAACYMNSPHPMYTRLPIASSAQPQDIDLRISCISPEQAQCMARFIAGIDRGSMDGSYTSIPLRDQSTYFPEDFLNAVAMTEIVIHADEPFEPSEEVKALFEQPKTWRDRFLDFLNKLRGDHA